MARGPASSTRPDGLILVSAALAGPQIAADVGLGAVAW
jgi:hypothetical protein